MRKVKRGVLAGTLSALIVAGLLTTNFVVAQTSSGEAQEASLNTLINAAVASRSYAQSVLNLATSSGVNATAASTLFASGVSSFNQAEAELSPGVGNATVGIRFAHDAMANFTAAAASASAAIEAVLPTSATLQAHSGTIAALNQSALSISSAVNLTCADTTVSSSLASAFEQDCASANGSISSAEAELAAAASAGSGTGSASLDLSSAEAELTALSTFTYVSRGEAYVNGPLASQYAAANASAKLQGTLVSWFDTDVSDYQSLLATQSSVSTGITSSATTLSTAVASVSTSSAVSSIAAEQTSIDQVASSLTSIGTQLPTLSIPTGTLSTVEADTNNAETSTTAYYSALSTAGSSAGSFSSTPIGSFSSYLASFSSDEGSQSSDSAACASSLSTLQSELATAAGSFPLVTILGTWETDVSQDQATIASGSSLVTTSLQGQYSGMSSVNSDVATLASSVGEVGQVTVGSGLIQNISSISSSGAGLLNSTALASLSSASSSLQTDAQTASSYISSSQGLLQTNIGGFSAAWSATASQATALSSQGQSTSKAMSGASTYLSSDLAARTLAIASAQSLISQALAAFGSGQVAQGASFSAQASAEFAIASSGG